MGRKIVFVHQSLPSRKLNRDSVDVKVTIEEKFNTANLIKNYIWDIIPYFFIRLDTSLNPFDF